MANANLAINDEVVIFNRFPLDPSPPGQWLRRLHDYLLNGRNIVAFILTKLQQKSGIAKSLLLNLAVGVVLQIFLFASDYMQNLFSTLFVLPYALCKNVIYFYDPRTFNHQNEADCNKWLLFWTIYATFKVLDMLISGVPFYWLSKTFFLLALILPPIDLSGKWYREWVHPLKYVINKRFDRRVFVAANGHLLKAMKMDRRYVKREDEYVIEKHVSEIDSATLLYDVRWKMPWTLCAIYAVFGTELFCRPKIKI